VSESLYFLEWAVEGFECDRFAHREGHSERSFPLWPRLDVALAAAKSFGLFTKRSRCLTFPSQNRMQLAV
jgi:hypothetical protein